MKTKIYIVLAALGLIVCSALTISAQPVNNGILFGLKAGINFSDVYGTYPNGSFSSLTGFQVGGIVDFGITPNFSIAPELLFTTKGAQSTSITTTTSPNHTVTDENNEKVTLDYIEIPVLAKYRFSTGFHIEAGPYIGFLTSATATGTHIHTDTGPGGTTTTTSINTSSTSGYSSTDAGIAVGVGYRFPVGLGIDLRYDAGFSNLYNPPLQNTYTNSTFTIAVDYLFGMIQ